MSDAATSIILTTINAPYRTKIDADTLAACIRDHALAKLHAGPISGFFMEIPEAKRKAFAMSRGISHQDLRQATELFMNWTGHQK